MKPTARATRARRESARPAGTPWLALASLVALALIAYLPALRNGFVWDDDANVTGNQTLRSLAGLAATWTDTYANQQFYPLTHTAFWIEYQLWGLHPFGYHLVNVLLHGVSAALFFLLLSRLSVRGAWLGAALFALHPVHVESVAWVTELKNCLSGALFMGTLVAYADFADLGAPPGVAPRGGRRGAYVLAIALFICALLAKTATAPLPVALLVILWWRRGRLAARDLLPLVPLFLAAFLMGITTAWLEQHHVGAKGEGWDLTFAGRVVVAGRALWFYLGKLVWPARLSFIYPRWTVNPGDVLQFAYPAGVLAAFALLLATRKRIGSGPLAALAFFVAMLLPALGFFRIYFTRYSYVADHFQYFASLGPLAALGALLALAGDAIARRFGAAARTVLVAAPLVTLGVLTWSGTPRFADAETLWRVTIAQEPTAWLAHNNLAAILIDRREFEAAAAECRAALRDNPGYAPAHDNLGIALAELGQLDEALEQHRLAVRLDPGSPSTHAILAQSLARAGRFDEALASCDTALELDPRKADWHRQRATVLAQLGRADEAIAEYHAALGLETDDPEALVGLGVILARVGRLDDAIEVFRKLARTGKGPPEGHAYYARALYLKGDLVGARSELETCRRLGGQVPLDLERALLAPPAAR